MDSAFDTFRQRIVRANECQRGYFPERYQCLCCKNEVWLASGDIYAPYFRHNHTLNIGGCDLYVQGYYEGGAFTDVEFEARDIELVAEFSIARGEPACSFCVRFRPTGIARYFDFDSEGEALRYNINGRDEIFIPVREVADHYRLISSDGVVHLLDGFSSSPSIFRYTSSKSVRIPLHRRLKPGIYIGCFSGNAPEFPEQTQPFAIQNPNNHIKVIGFEIPRNPTNVTRSFLSNLGIKLKLRLVNYAILHPLDIIEESEDVWATGSDRPLDVLVRFEGTELDYLQHKELLIQRRSGSQLHKIETQYLAPGKVHRLSLDLSENVSLIRIGIKDPTQFIAEFNYSSKIPIPISAHLYFEFKEAGQTNTTRLHWGSVGFESALSRVRSGELSVVRVALPLGISVRIVDSEKSTDVPEDSPGDFLTSSLRKSRGPVTLGAKGYPDVLVADSREPSAPPARGAKGLDDRKRDIHPARLRQAHALMVGSASQYSTFGARR